MFCRSECDLPNLLLNATNPLSRVTYSQKLLYKAASRYIKQSEKKEMLLQMLQWMLSHGYVIDSSTKDLIRENSHLFGEQLGTELLSNAFQAACDVGTNKIP